MSPVIATVDVDRPAAEVFAYATDPTRFPEWQAGVDGQLDHAGTKCVTTRRIGGAERPVTSELTHIDPPRTWGVHGIDGPVRATVDLTVAPLTETRSRLTSRSTSKGTASAKVLVPLLVRRQAQKESPTNVANLKRQLESQEPRSGV